MSFMCRGYFKNILYRSKDEYGNYLVVQLEHKDFGILISRLYQSCWPIQHVQLLMGCLLEFLPTSDGNCWVFPLNNQNPNLIQFITQKLLTGGLEKLREIDYVIDNGSEDDSVEDDYKDEIGNLKSILEHIFNDLEVGDQNEEGKTSNDDELPF